MDLGELGDVVRELADYQVECYAQVMKWPLAEALAAYEQRLREDAQRVFIVDYLAWNIRAQAGSKEKAPQLPAILQE